MKTRLVTVAAAVLALAGCATPNWQNVHITDKSSRARQLIIDDGYCLRVANGSVPMPQIVASETPTTTNFSGSATTYNSTTGSTSHGNYYGQATTVPSGSFTSGFANGLNIGAALTAQRDRAAIHKSCMYAKGWVDAPVGIESNTTVSTVKPASTLASPVTSSPSTVPAVAATLIYETPMMEWRAETEEFLLFYPSYQTGFMRQRIDSKVRTIAKAQPTLTGPQILLAAHASLTAADQAAKEPPKNSGLSGPLHFYKGAAAGNALDQVAFGVMRMQGSSAFPQNFERAAAWLQKSALAGNSIAQEGFGTLLFEGKGLPENKVKGYMWVQKAAVTETDAQKILTRFRAQMTPAELRQVQ